ncbi:MAG: DNA-processing protein DprA [Candidatus Eisenbacteria bacterium]|nr:DNA-processing protein DprA [Candidatus Eisenbacteria bacterium]
MLTEESRRAAIEAALRSTFDDPGLRPGRLIESPVSWLARQTDRLMALDAFVLRPGDADYPEMLVGIEDEPACLFARGRRPLPGQPLVAIIGSRRPTASGLRFAQETARLLVRHGLAVVSGMARGIDGEAHRAALEAADDLLPSIGVLATGLDVVYPPEHRALQSAMAERGLLLTEFPPGSPPLRYHFLRRNRLLSGLATLVVVVEARARSGALVTVGHALSQGRDVGAVPGDVFSEASVGSNHLLTEGATPFTSPGAVLQRLIDQGHRALPGSGRDLDLPTSSARPFPPAFRPLESHFSSRPTTLEELAALTNRPVARLLAELLELEMAGCVRRWPGGFVRA